jgi:pseudouridine-5'-phosphate glycosidase
MIEPKVIVVSNAFVSNILQAELDIVFDETLGCHFIDLKNKAYPVFFTSMLTGQRALDKGSMMRLKWHIKRVL